MHKVFAEEREEDLSFFFFFFWKDCGLSFISLKVCFPQSKASAQTSLILLPPGLVAQAPLKDARRKYAPGGCNGGARITEIFSWEDILFFFHVYRIFIVIFLWVLKVFITGKQLLHVIDSSEMVWCLVELSYLHWTCLSPSTDCHATGRSFHLHHWCFQRLKRNIR